MTWHLFWSVVLLAAMGGGVWALVCWTERRAFELGAQACRDGLPMNIRWSKAMKDGWMREYLLRMLTARRAGQ